MPLLYVVVLGTFFKPVTAGIIIGFIFLVVLLACTALVSGSEMAFFSLDAKQLDELKSKKKNHSHLIIQLLKQPQKLLATILITNNFFNVSIVILSTYLTINLFDLTGHYVLSFLIEFVVLTALILLFGEMLPKIYASQNPLKFASMMAAPMKFLTKIFSPLSFFMVRSTGVIERRLSKKKQVVSFEDLSDAIELTSDEITQQQERKILKGIVKFADIEVSQVMKPRIDVVAAEYNINFHQLIHFIQNAGFSRIPVYKKTFDHIAGILYIKDLLQYIGREAAFNWQTLIRPPFYVPENKKINDLLSEFKEKKIHMAVVVDEYGGTSGIVTMEDVIEEIVGEISDEYDTESEDIDFTKIDDYTYIFDAKTSLNDLAKKINFSDEFFSDIKGESESIAGLILEMTGKIPQKNETINIKDLSFTILSSDIRRIKKVKVIITPPYEESQEE
ncbi:MAG TPA: gliding motility-associated protein GldE [Bacteroidales bacterium]|nr:gliding motility-associated protein GldE [Bacteroidales bacterium]HNZ42152.1 gliding motility-associated protein GldE [Bacteroidales bacterium]HPB25083.1 gliding motility-associated protein GldE [Bacteroidales bacterium]HPI31438.1 gliding motility-associated protein GldE [Bacteroidales bacterium]HQP14756.1 gliding motility-associated protein GldE [Bacteroidales bacterium]